MLPCDILYSSAVAITDDIATVAAEAVAGPVAVAIANGIGGPLGWSLPTLPCDGFTCFGHDRLFFVHDRFFFVHDRTAYLLPFPSYPPLLPYDYGHAGHEYTPPGHI